MRPNLVILLACGIVAAGCSAGRPEVVAVRADEPQPVIVDAAPGELDPSTPAADTVTVAGLPVRAGAAVGVGQSSLLDPSTEPFATAHASQLIETAGGLVIVGSREIGGMARRPTLWFVGESEIGFRVDEPLALERRDDSDRAEAAAIDAVELWDGDLRVLGREDDPIGGSHLIVWDVSPERSVEIEHRFAAADMGADARRVLLDDAEHTWIVSASTKRDGALDVAVDLTPDAPEGWVTVHVPNGSGRHVRAVTLGEDLYVVAAVGSTPATLRWVARRFHIADDEVEVTEVAFGDGLYAIQDVERIDDHLVLLVVGADGSMSIRRSVDAIAWETVEIPGRAGDVPLSVVGTDAGVVVLITNPADENGRAVDVRSMILGVDGFVPWAEPFVQIAGPPRGDFDLTSVAYGNDVVVLDRIPDLRLSLMRVSPGGLRSSLVDVESWQPPFIETVERLLEGPSGPIAVVGRTAPIGLGNTWEPDGPERIMELADGRWRTVGRAQVHGVTMWRGQPVLAVPADGPSTEWYTVADGELQLLGSTNRFQVVGEMVTVGDELYATAQVGDDLHLFVGTVDGEMNPVDELWGMHAAELCASADRVFVIIESRVDTTRTIAEVADGHLVRMIDGVPSRAEYSGAPPQCVARDRSLGVLYEFDTTDPFTALGAWWFDLEAGTPTEVAAESSLRSGRALASVSGDLTTEVVGLALDQWDTFDAIWWTFDEFGAPVERVVIGGPGIQEANSVLRVSDGYLIGGTDDGEPVVWLIPDE